MWQLQSKIKCDMGRYAGNEFLTRSVCSGLETILSALVWYMIQVHVETLVHKFRNSICQTLRGYHIG